MNVTFELIMSDLQTCDLWHVNTQETIMANTEPLKHYPNKNNNMYL